MGDDPCFFRFINLGFSGPKHTLSNKREDGALIMDRIDNYEKSIVPTSIFPSLCLTSLTSLLQSLPTFGIVPRYISLCQVRETL